MLVADHVSRAMPYLQGCPSFVIEDALRDAVEIFCRETRILRETVSIPLVEGTDTYTITPAMADVVVAETLYATIDSDHIEPITPDIASRLIVNVLIIYTVCG